MFFRKTKIIKAQKIVIATLEKELERLRDVDVNNKTLRNKISSLKKQIRDLRGY